MKVAVELPTWLKLNTFHAFFKDFTKVLGNLVIWFFFPGHLLSKIFLVDAHTLIFLTICYNYIVM